GELRDAGRYRDRRAARADRLRRAARDRADRAREAARRLPARGVPVGERCHRPDRRPAPDARQAGEPDHAAAAPAGTRELSAPAKDLSGWLEYIERIHPKTIEMGLERVREVRERLGSDTGAALFVVGGTNGKGSTCAMLEAIALAAGWRVGLYTSPHLLRYNERVRMGGREVEDERLCAAFDSVERARARSGGEVPLTYFEFGTLAAWEIFCAEALDVVILEVGLGGRLDAVNVFDADCAVLTSIGIDHVDYLGPTRESIGAEKAGIFRAGLPAIVADPQPPRSVLDAAARLGADLRLIGRDFGYSAERGQWLFWGREGRRAGLAYPALRGASQLANASAALAALETLRARLPVAAQDVRTGLARVELPGRFQVLPGRPTV